MLNFNLPLQHPKQLLNYINLYMNHPRLKVVGPKPHINSACAYVIHHNLINF